MRSLTPAARRYLLFAALLTFGLSISSLFYNLLLVALGFDERTLTLPIVGPLSLLGLLNSLPVAVAGLSSLPIWLLVSRFGPQPALIVGALLLASSLFGAALFREPLLLLLAAAIGGPGSVLFQVSAAPFMMRHSGPDERDALFSLSAAINIGVAGLGSLVGGFVPGLIVRAFGIAPQSAAAYGATMAVAGTITAFAAVPLLFNWLRTNDQRPGTNGEQPPPAGDEQLQAAEQRAARLRLGRSSVGTFLGYVRGAIPFMVAPLLISFGAALLIPYLNLYFRQRYGAPDAALGVIFAAIGVATGIATLAAPLLSRRLGKIGSVILTQTLAIPCLLLLGLSPVLWLAAGVALLRGALMNMASPLYDAYAMERTPEPARPLVIGLINGAFATGYLVGPTISAEVQRRAGFEPLFLVTAAFYACAALATYLIFVRRARRKTPILQADAQRDQGPKAEDQ